MGTYNPKLPTKHTGTDKYITFFVSRNREPTLADYRQPETGTLYSIGTIWQVSKDPTTGTQGEMWILTKIIANQGYWVRFSSGTPSSGPVLSLSDTANTLVYPTVAGNIQLEGTPGIEIISDPGDNKLVFSLTGGGGFAWNDVSGAFSPLNNNGYFITGTATGTLPASPDQGDTIKFFVDHASQTLTIVAPGTQIIRLGSLVSSAGGTIESTLQGDSIELTYRTVDTCWCAIAGFSGTWILT